MQLMPWALLQGCPMGKCDWHTAASSRTPLSLTSQEQQPGSITCLQWPATNSSHAKPPIWGFCTFPVSHFPVFPCSHSFFYSMHCQTKHKWPDHSCNTAGQFLCSGICMPEGIPVGFLLSQWTNSAFGPTIRRLREHMTAVMKIIDFKSISSVKRVPLTPLWHQILKFIHLLWWQTSFKNI